MKLNYKRTFNIGFAFFSIMMLWQVYNFAVPLFLEDSFENIFHTSDKIIIGIIMALDNLFALFMIPIISKMSDNCKSRYGKRTPFIVIGILLAALSFLLLPFTYIYVQHAMLDGSQFEVLFLVVNLILVLIFMNIYRSPAAALMPDITPRPLRSKGNSIINIMGGIGGAMGFAATMLYKTPIAGQPVKLADVIFPFLLTSVLMLICLTYFLIQVREKKFKNQMETELAEYNRRLASGTLPASEIMVEPDEPDEKEMLELSKRQTKKGRQKLPFELILVLAAVFFMYMANNAVETFMSLYCNNLFGSPKFSIMMTGAFAVTGFIFVLPSAQLATKFGKRKMVMIGFLTIAIGYILAFIFTLLCVKENWSPVIMIIPFALGGIGFSSSIINIYPMSIQYCSSSKLGQFTGYYYAASMLAQSITPALCGASMIKSMLFLLPYAAIFMILAYLCMIWLGRHQIRESDKTKV